jgi:hypothetical protein
VLSDTDRTSQQRLVADADCKSTTVLVDRQLVRGSVASHCNNHSRIYKTHPHTPSNVVVVPFYTIPPACISFFIYYKDLELTLRGYRAAAAQSVISNLFLKK